MLGLIIAVHVIVCVFLIFLNLIQPGKGYGLSETFGGQAQTIFGTRAGTLITRITAISATIFLIASLGIAIISGKRTTSIMERLKEGEVKKEVVGEKSVPPVESSQEVPSPIQENASPNQ
ncbi:MAG: preprotein translocase subunit SecG [Candidatus Omnitrophica bacterium]|nr:preprotein translocase subunit SecG [Candidatus Omnitrophota bacterium]